MNFELVFKVLAAFESERPPEGTFYMDILTRLGEVYRFDNVASQRVDFGGLQVTVATPAMLYEMKKATVRPKDWGDAEMLRRRFRLGGE